ncbi:acyltransferase domain-containing protein (plasmid) [Deinococcus sp. KNUC1210]|uniref:type I polyketide synthase n=1 Tax=Deinococcus sp. KNUC1210 TaxID=2917691 RepID=UPI001EF14FC8|nr:type I polyketide synthase [Deinococcus sp. KNUC1210]ULH14296.1 acyltransferase domain-containing protein [Deinococcus sp. KNUC1210]
MKSIHEPASVSEPSAHDFSAREPIAIIGIGCRFPGESSDPQSYWQFLKSGADAVTEVPANRWLVDAYFHPDHHAPGRMYARWGGFIRDIDQFDAPFFGISPREAARMDPQQRLLLEVADEAFQDAGLPPSTLAGSDTGVFVGLSTCDYAGIQTAASARQSIDPFTNLGVGSCIAANRISYHYDFHGPSFIVDTACSSSLVAVSMACKAIWNGECGVALSGAANLMLRPENTMGFAKSQMLSPAGRCRSFDADASGYVRSEGVGVVVLKPLSRAQADGDRIYAVIRAADLNQDGRTGGIALPNGEAQAALLASIYAGAGLDPAKVRYVEAHGTGTAAGDPIEVNALGSVLRSTYHAGQGSECLIGSVKSNMGHLEAASGMAGLIKAALSIQHGEIPGNLHFDAPNPAIPFERYGLRVAVGQQPWPTEPDGSRSFLTGINSFGFGGTNAHVVLDAAPEHRQAEPAAVQSGPQLFVFSAHSQQALRAVAAAQLHDLDDHPEMNLSALAYSLGRHRDHYPFRLSLAAGTVTELNDALEAFLADEHRPGMAQGRILAHEGNAATGLPLAFVFSGMGPQWFGMGRELYAQEPVFRAALDEIDALLTPYTGWSLLAELNAPEDASRIDETFIAQPALFAVQVALARLWASWGIVPDVIVGHSLGEAAAAHVAGALSLPDAVHLIYQRSHLQHLTAGQGRMLAADVPLSRAEELVAGEAGRISIAAVNSSSDITLAGDTASLERVAAQLDAQDTFNSFLKVEVPFHSPVMDQIRAAFYEGMQGLIPRAPTIPMVSTVTGLLVEGAELDVNYWWRNIRQSVQFAPAMRQILSGGPHVFLEVSAHPVLSQSMARCIAGAPAAQARTQSVALPSLRRRERERTIMLGSLGRLYTLGQPLDWTRIHAAAERLPLPRYPWQHERYWNETPQAQRERLGLKVHPLLGERLGLPAPVWENVLDAFSLPGLKDHVVQGAVVFPGAAYVELALAAARETGEDGETGCVLHDLNFVEALVLPPPNSRILQTTLDTRHGLRVYSAAPTDLAAQEDGAWTLHAQGTLRRLGGQRPAAQHLHTLKADCSLPVNLAEFYARFSALGLQYGPAFQGIERLWTGQGTALGALKPHHQDGTLLPPSVLDACFQLLLGAVSTLPQVQEDRLYLPVQIRDLSFYGVPHGELYAHARLTHWEGGRVSGDIVLLSAEGEVFAEVSGLHCQAIDAAGAGLDSLLYQDRWEARSLSVAAAPLWTTLPAPQELLAIRDDLLTRTGTPADRADFERLSARLAGLYAQAALLELESVQAADLLETVRELAVAGEPAANPRAEAGALWRSLWARFPGHQAELHLLAQAGSSLTGRLRGERAAVSPALHGHLRHASPDVRGVHALLRGLVGRLADGGTELRVLEVGALAGGLSQHLWGLLVRPELSWTLADPDAEQLEEAVARLGLPAQQLPAVRALTLAQDPAAQGWDGQTFDLILGVDAVSSPDELTRLSALLSPGGVLALEYTTRVPAWTRLLPELEQAVVPLEAWASAAGLQDLNTLPAVPEAELNTHALLWGRTSAAAPAAPVSELPATAPGHWLLVADDAGFAASVQAELTLRQQRVTLAPDPAQAEALLAELSAETPLTGVVFACTLALPQNAGPAELLDAEESGAHRLLALVQALARQDSGSPDAAPALWIITRGAQAVVGPDLTSPLAAELWGLARVVGVEYPAFSPRCLDLDPHAPTADLLAALSAELLAASPETEVALRRNTRFVHRLTRATLAELAPASPDGQGNAYRLTVPRPGVLGSLGFLEVPRRAPGAGEVEIRVQAAALNFKDIMLAMGMLPGEALEGGYTGRAYGMEAAGEVVRVGEGVSNVQPGDSVVICAKDALSTYLTVPATFAVPAPANIGHEALSAIPIAFMTAYYALHTLAQMGPEDSVLIHAAAGGVGLAAIALAQRAGATIFATAGTPEKRELLHSLGVAHVLDSRTLNFAEDLLALTEGRGVDIVLNSLSGDAIGRSLAVLRPYGRFVEIGKRDIYANSPLDLGPFRNNLSYFAVDLDRMWVDRPAQMRRLLSEVMGLFESGELAPLTYRVFPFREALSAFRFMAQARHTGKVVLSMEGLAGPDVPELPNVLREPPPLTLRPDGFYVISGGLGGFGLALAQWLVQHGARRLALLGRSEGSAGAQAQVEALRAAGAEVRVERADISETATLEAVLNGLRAAAPLLGVFHAAMVIDDVLLEGLTPERLARVTRPKVLGGWNLHTLTLNDPLDFFVCFSSVSALLGNPGQANYAAANTFLDALAGHRRGLGLPALSVNWGAVQGVGYLAQETGVAARLEAAGVPPVPVTRLLAALEALLSAPVAGVGVADVRWPALASARGVALPPRLAGLLGAESADAGAGQGSAADFVETLRLLGEEERQALLLHRLAEQLARILGTSPGKLDPDQAIMKMGVDSLMAVELGGQIQAETGVKIPPMKFVGGVTLRGLTDFVLEGLELTAGAPESSQPEALHRVPADLAPPVESLREDQLAALREDQLDALLAELLSKEATPPASGGA